MSTVTIGRSVALLALAFSLSACIGSPLSGDSVAALYPWSERDTPLTTRPGLDTGDESSGDYLFVDLVLEHPALASRGEEPWLLESCDDQRCLSMVLFGSDFELKESLELGGYAILTPLASLMANQVRNLPAGDVRATLDALSARLRSDAVADYAEFIRLDTRLAGEERRALRYPALYDEATALLQQNPRATVEDLLDRPAQRTADLVASQRFDFDSSWELQVNVDVADRFGGSAYLLICGGFTPDNSGFAVDYNSCALRAPLAAGLWQGSLTLTGTTTEILAVLLDVSDPSQPEYRLWRRGIDGDALLIR